MNKSVMLAAVGLLGVGVAVGGCQGVSLPIVAAKATEAKVSATELATIRRWCSFGEPLLKMGANFTTSTTVGEITAFVGSYCAQLNAGVIPVTTDANTDSWLSRNLNRLRELLRV